MHETLRFGWIAVAAAGVLITAAAPAQRSRGASSAVVWEHLRQSYDKNRDGVVTAEEYGRGADKFARFDRDGDGELSQADFGAGGRSPRDMGPRIAGRVLRNADGDADGEVTGGELDAYLGELDVDADGAVTEAALAAMVPVRGRGGMSAMVRAGLDRDGDGAVRLEDLRKAFGELDRDKNGVLAREELSARGGSRDARGRTERQRRLPQRGDVAPGFDLPYAKEAEKTAKLSSFAGDKPVALIFGSYT